LADEVESINDVSRLQCTGTNVKPDRAVTRAAIRINVCGW
jgi:hypothetical protein